MIPRSLYRAAVIGRLAGHDPNPPRVGIFLAKVAAWSAIGGVAVVLAVPVLALLSHLLP